MRGRLVGTAHGLAHGADGDGRGPELVDTPLDGVSDVVPVGHVAPSRASGAGQRIRRWRDLPDACTRSPPCSPVVRARATPMMLARSTVAPSAVLGAGEAAVSARRKTSTVSSRPRSWCSPRDLTAHRAGAAWAAVAELARITIGSAAANHLAQLLQALGDVHRVPDQRVVEPVARADVAHHGRAGMEAEPSRSGGTSPSAQHPISDQQGRAHRPCGMVGLRQGRAPERHHSIVQELSTVPRLLERQPARSSKCPLSKSGGGARGVQLLGQASRSPRCR